MSGLALTSFILALILGFFAVFLGLWWLAVLTGVLGIWGMRRADPTRFRGRGFAITAIVLSVIGAILGYSMTSLFQSEIQRITTDICRTLDADGVEEDKRVHRLNDWIHERVVEEGVAEQVLARWRKVEERMGAYVEPLEPFSIFAGYFGALTPPSDAGLVDVDDPTKGVPAFSAGKVAMWGRAKFEKGTVYIGLFIYGEGGSSLDVQSRLEAGHERARLFSDIRFYVPPTGR